MSNASTTVKYPWLPADNLASVAIGATPGARFDNVVSGLSLGVGLGLSRGMACAGGSAAGVDH